MFRSYHQKGKMKK